MKAYLLFHARGPVLIISKYDSIQDKEFQDVLKKAYSKFIVHDALLDPIKSCYGAHFEHILTDPSQTDDLRVLDTDGDRIFTNVNFTALGQTAYYDPDMGLFCRMAPQAGARR